MSDDLRLAFLACTRGDFAVLERLVPAKVNVNDAVFLYFTDISVYFLFTWAVSAVSCRHVTMLHIAAGCGQCGCIEYLLHNKADPNMRDLVIFAFI